MAPLSIEAVSEALVARFERPHCEGDHCFDPFPLWGVTGMAVAGDRIALAGPGALLSLYEEGTWVTLVAPAGDATEPDQIAVHDVAFSEDGAHLVAVGGQGRIWDVRAEGMTERPGLASYVDEDGVGATLSAVVVASDAELWVLEAEGRVFRIRGDQIDVRQVIRAADHLLTVPGRTLSEALIVSGPFAGRQVDDVFGEARTTTFHSDAQLLLGGEYGGCGIEPYDDRLDEILAEMEGLREDAPTMSDAEALTEATRRIGPRTDAPPAGLVVPGVGLPDALSQALRATAAGRAIASLVERAPASSTASARRGALRAVATLSWDGRTQLWARLAGGGVVFEAPGLGRISALDVSADRVLFVAADGRVGQLRLGEEAPTMAPPRPELAGAHLLRVIDEEHALIAADRALYPVLLSDLSVGAPRPVPQRLLALEGDADALFGAGEGGLIVRITETEVVRIESGVTAHLSALLLLGDGELVAAGAAGTLVRVGEGPPRRLPRITSEEIVALAFVEGTVFAETERGVVLRASDEHVWARASDRPSVGWDRGLFAPGAAPSPLPFSTRETPLRVAVDEPSAIAAFPIIAARYDARADRFPVAAAPVAAPYRSDALADVLFRWEGSLCCDPGYPPSESESLVAFAQGEDCDAVDCEGLLALDWTHRLVSLSRGTEVSVVRSAGDCPGYQVVVRRIGGAELSRHEIPCSGDPQARDLALQSHLATLEIDATWEPASGVHFETPLDEDGTGLFVRSRGTRQEVVMVRDGNRASSVLLALPRGTRPIAPEVPVELRVAVVDGYDADPRYVALSAEGLWWSGPTPEALGGAAVDERADCPLEVADPDGATTLRVGPTSRSEALGTLTNGTEVTVERREGRWIAITAPQRGWLFERNVHCR